MTENKDFIIEGDTLVKYTGSAESVIVPSGVTVIGERAFAENHNIVTVDLNDVVSVGDYAFFFCRNLLSVTAKKVRTIGHSAFRANWIKEMVLRDVERLEDSAFFGCIPLKEIGSTPNLVYIGSSAFSGARLERIEINKNATRIGESAFSSCEFTEFDYPDGIEEVEGCVFAGCHRLKRITFPKALKRISIAAFQNCERLRRVEIPEGVTFIHYDAFMGCNIAEVYNKSQLDIRYGRHKRIGFLPEHAVNVFTPNDGYDTHEEIDGYVFCTDSHDTNRTFLIDYVGDEKNLVLPRDYHGREYGIFRYVFAERDIESIDLGDSATEIGSFAFFKCKNLKSVKFGSGLKYVYRNAFHACENLTEAELGDNVELLGRCVFLNTGIRYLKFGAGMKEIRGDAIGGCRNLSTIYYTGTPEQFDGIRVTAGLRDWYKKSVRFYSETERPNCWRYVHGKIKEY
ncbi:MAG: leucine-rich repeat domain-containing protein [Clostridiales bacterium]|nr:leucine-rich repeat domain-containing protein [Clostridiales bacterium]